jgi:hypothetical protein
MEICDTQWPRLSNTFHMVIFSLMSLLYDAGVYFILHPTNVSFFCIIQVWVLFASC